MLMVGVAGGAVLSSPSQAAECGDAVQMATPSRLATQKLLIDVAQAADRIVAVGEFGHVIYSDDDGLNWQQADQVETQVTLTSVTFPTEKIGYAVGHDAVINHRWG